jgi:hypothetical protein
MCAICDFKLEFDIGHPQALTVAVATRAAIDAGTLTPEIFDGPLGDMKLRFAATNTLKTLQRRIEAAISADALMALPDFYILLIESNDWGYFRPTETGFDSECVPDLPNVNATNQAERSIVLITTQATMQTMLGGKLSLRQAFEDRLMILDASEDHATLLDAALNAAIPAEGFSRFICN